MRHRRWTFVLTVGLVGLSACADPGPDHAVLETIGPRGGLVSSYDQVLTIVLQPGALSHEVEIEVFPSDEPPAIFGLAYRVRPQLELLVDAEITYRRVLPSNPDAATVAAIRLDDYTDEMGHWVALPRLAITPEQSSVIASDDQLSLYYGLLEVGNASGDDEESGDTTMGVDPTTAGEDPGSSSE